MLEPGDRLLLFEALRPPEGFRFDQGIGTTYSLDLIALLTAPLAFTWFEQPGDDTQVARVNSLEILESLRRHADQLTIFCHAGRIALPKVVYPQLAFLEEAVVECQASDGGAFHPKVWALRWVNDEGEVRHPRALPVAQPHLQSRLGHAARAGRHLRAGSQVGHSRQSRVGRVCARAAGAGREAAGA